MDPTALRGILRRFPLLGRPRPTYPALPDRVAEVVDIAATATATRDLSDAAHALNKAALIASDHGDHDLARRWCWRHIDTYRRLDCLTVTQASYLLEPVLNLARLQIRADRGEPALQLLRRIYLAVTTGSPLVVDGHTMPTLLPPPIATPDARAELRQLHQWAWLQYLSEGIRVLALAGRWDDAVTHATSLNGIGHHLMDGRQAAIIAHLLNNQADKARDVLAETTATESWEHQVEACLAVLCAESRHTPELIPTMVQRFVETNPVTGYAVFRARLGITVAGLANAHDAYGAGEALHVLRLAASEAISAGDGYAAREISNHRTGLRLNQTQKDALDRIVQAAGLGAGTLEGAALQSLTCAVDAAEQIVLAQQA